MQRHHGIAHHRGEDDVRLRRFEFVDDRREFGVPERNVFFRNDFAAVLLKKLLAVIVLFLRIDVVRSDQIELLAEFVDQPGDEFILLLIGNGAGVDHVLRAFAPFVERRIPVEIVLALEHRQYRLAARRRIGAEHADALVADDEFTRLIREGRGIRCRILYHRNDLHALDAAGRVDLFDREKRGFIERFFDDCRRAGE